MIPTLKNISKFFHPHTHGFSPPSFLRFYCRETHKCFREPVTIFLKKPKKERENLFLVLFQLEYKLPTGVLNAAM